MGSVAELTRRTSGEVLWWLPCRYPLYTDTTGLHFTKWHWRIFYFAGVTTAAAQILQQYLDQAGSNAGCSQSCLMWGGFALILQTFCYSCWMLLSSVGSFQPSLEVLRAILVGWNDGGGYWTVLSAVLGGGLCALSLKDHKRKVFRNGELSCSLFPDGQLV